MAARSSHYNPQAPPLSAGQGTEDVIDLRRFGFDDLPSFGPSGLFDTAIDLGFGNSITLSDVLPTALHQDDFLV